MNSFKFCVNNIFSLLQKKWIEIRKENVSYIILKLFYIKVYLKKFNWSQSLKQ